MPIKEGGVERGGGGKPFPWNFAFNYITTRHFYPPPKKIHRTKTNIYYPKST